ncbi:TPA_asm: glycosyltransferase family 2 protein [Salmonella enterica subsp. enterica serovar Typhimurium]|uniref:Glycosyltransferase family 2 protein n=1 Tax=Salmonella typhimurium TaxID=90371 RepID=A0A708AHW8_SALTM|nr:glycosyltransferase family 2 protein [Salmonella enterica subsp. enterica serovar Typhimurium]
MYFLLQKVILPNIDLCTEEQLYFRTQGGKYNYTSRNLLVPRHKVAYFDTFFNAFSIKKWKKYTTLTSLFLRVNIIGRGTITVRHKENGVIRVLKQIDFKSSCNISDEIEIDISKINFGYIYVEWQSDEDSVLNGFEFLTKDHVSKSSMALVITTYNRKEAVTKTINRINKTLLTQSEFKDRFKLIVVNNGEAINHPSGNGIIVINNENLGGSGGFMRGLIEAGKINDVKHVIFMDDDGSCEIESICRTHAFLLMAKDKNTVVTGCMLFEDNPAIIHESGAIWHRDYSFPFFVRGDDLLFGYMHKKHNIVTLNGVASWQMDFERKISVLNSYLNFRTVAVPALISKRKFAALLLSVFFVREVFLASFSCRYELARAMIMSYNDCLSGREFWEDNVDLLEIRKRINAITHNEKFNVEGIDIVNGCVDYPCSGKEKAIYKFFRCITLNGHLIPAFFLIKKPIVVDYRHYHPTKFSFRRITIYHLNIENGKLLKLTHSKMEFFKVIINGLFTAVKNFYRFKSAKKEMKNSLPYLTSKLFWYKKFNKKSEDKY